MAKSHEPVMVDVVIIGAGVTGTAAAYVLAEFTDVDSMVLIEACSSVAMVNSDPHNNSQTLHHGDTETNYDLEHALKVLDAAVLMRNFIGSVDMKGLYDKTARMVLAVGASECALLRERYREFKPHYPELQLLDRFAINTLDRRIVQGRDRSIEILALYTPEGYAVNYQKLSQAFLNHAFKTETVIETKFDSTVEKLVRLYHQEGGTAGYLVETSNGNVLAKSVVVAAGPYSLLFAQSLGYGQHLGILPVAGSFYLTDHTVLRNKWYTMQIEGLPFAAVHGDPDLTIADGTRFGPTAKMIPLLQRHKYNSMSGFFRRPLLTRAGIKTLLHILSNGLYTKFMFKNFFYDWPVIGKHLYLKEMRKIVPSLKWSEVRLGKGLGGIRPQVFDTITQEMHMGESALVGDDGDPIVFYTTPSPGASVCLANAEKATRLVMDFLGEDYSFDEERFNTELRKPITV